MHVIGVNVVYIYALYGKGSKKTFSNTYIVFNTLRYGK